MLVKNLRLNIMTSPSDSYHYQEIILDSGDRKYGTNNVPDFQFDQNIDDSQYFQVHRVTIPTTYYVFDTTRTQMEVDAVSIVWPAGNYTAAEWVAIVNPQLPGDVQVAYDPVTNKLVFTSSSAFDLRFDTADPVTGRFQNGYTELGFRPAVIYNSALVSGDWTIASEFAVNFSGPNFVYLRSNMAGVFNNSEMYFSNTTVTNTGGDILAMIPIDENRNSVVYYIDHSNHMFPWKQTGNKRFSMYFTLGRRTDVLDFNGISFQVRMHGYSVKESGPFKFNR